VKIPMMPKGVEHFEQSRVRALRDTVKIPMMPKGVEHVVGYTGIDERNA